MIAWLYPHHTESKTMNLHTTRFLIALALSLGLTLVAVGQGSRSSGQVAAAPVHKALDSSRYSAPLATTTVDSPRSSQTWRSLLPGSMR